MAKPDAEGSAKTPTRKRSLGHPQNGTRTAGTLGNTGTGPQIGG